MSESEKEPIFFFKGSDPAMIKAIEQAQETFKYFWREISWESRRIIPGLDFACVKVPFSDKPFTDDISDNDDVEHMWLNEIDFDGEQVSGVLANEPNWLKSVSAGDEITVPFHRITDWMYASRGKVYGGFSVNAMRSGMSYDERDAHDEAWELEFCDPDTVRVCYKQLGDENSQDIDLFYGDLDNAGDHPMSLNMADSLDAELNKNKEQFTEYIDHKGFNILHWSAMAGSTNSVKTLLKHGFDPAVKTSNGKTARDLANLFGWDDVIALL